MRRNLIGLSVLIIFFLIFYVNFEVLKKYIYENNIVQSSISYQENGTGSSLALNPENIYRVIKVVDGDTIEVENTKGTEKVRLIGVDTPEMKNSSKTKDCFAQEATDETKKILLNNMVYLEPDLTQTDRDKYNRLLRYVTLEDGNLFNLELVKEGYGFEYTYNVPYKYQKEFLLAEKEAKENQRGLWNKVACQY